MREIERCILTGYYTAYYMNAGRKAKKPDELLRSMTRSKQSFDEGMRRIEKYRRLEREKEKE